MFNLLTGQIALLSRHRRAYSSIRLARIQRDFTHVVFAPKLSE
jgi:hypothetical protein